MINIKVLIPSKDAESTQTTQYTATGVMAIIDKFTATNHTDTAVQISVNLVNPSGAAADTNVVTKTKILQSNEVYTFPELVGHSIAAGGFISTLASVAAAISIRSSGREVS